MVLKHPFHNTLALLGSSLLHGALAFGLIYGSIGEKTESSLPKVITVELIPGKAGEEVSAPSCEKPVRKKKEILKPLKKTLSSSPYQNNKPEGGQEGSIKPCASNPPPPYPEEARLQGIEGVVLIKLGVNRQGAVARIECLNNAAPLLLESVLKTVKKWRFVVTGAFKEELTYIQVPLEFSLQD